MSKNLNLEQLVKDGFVQLKSLRQLQKQGILPKPLLPPVPFSNHSFGRNVNIMPSMLHEPGKVLKVAENGGIYLNQGLITLHNTSDNSMWFWPIECIKC